MRLRETIERGLRHRWAGPLFLLLVSLLFALTFLHGIHGGDHMATELGAFSLGLTVMFSLLTVIRLGRRIIVPIVQPRAGRAPPPTRSLPPAPRAARADPVPVQL